MKRLLTLFFVFLFVVSAVGFNNTFYVEADEFPINLTVVIDAGHGGKDWGAQGANTKVKESELNLEYAKELEVLFKNAGIKVVQTRTDENALCKDRFIKLEDMNNRVKIVKRVKSDMLISLHMNNFNTMPAQYGAQTFYNKGKENSKQLAEVVQTQLNKNQNKKRSSLGGDYYLLKNQNIPSIIVECGFLSNPTEERLLQTMKHRQKVTGTIFAGCVAFLSTYK